MGPLILMQQPCGGLVLSHHSLMAAGGVAAGGEAAGGEAAGGVAAGGEAAGGVAAGGVAAGGEAAGGEAAARPGGGSGTVMAFYLDSHLI